MNKLLERKKAIEVALLRTKAKSLHTVVYGAMEIELRELEVDLLNIKADILEATPIPQTYSMNDILDTFPEEFADIFKSKYYG